jgi:hypothetical protein
MRLTTALLILTAAVSMAACSSPKSEPKADGAADAAGAALADPIEAAAKTPQESADADAIVVTHSNDSLSIDNKLGRRLIGVRIELSVAETPQPYIDIVPTIEKDSKADIQLMMFKTESADVLVDPTAVHPKQVTIKAHDSFGRPHEVTVPWATE